MSNDGKFDSNKYLLEFKDLPEKDVVLWNWHDVKIWAHICDFTQPGVFECIEKNNIQGSALLNGVITPKDLCITDPWDINNFGGKIRKLKSRHIREKSLIARLIRKEEQYIETMRIKRKLEVENNEKENNDDGSEASLSSREDEGGFEEDAQIANEQDRMTEAGFCKWWKYESTRTADYKIITQKVGFVWRKVGYREKMAREDGSTDSSQTKEELEAEEKSLEDGTYVHHNPWFIWTSSDHGVTWKNSGEK
jgi:hypothetical protein